jgi:hypothetical protein
MIILNEIHSDKMEFLIYALKTHTFKVLVANEDEWRPREPFLLMYVTRN